MSILTKAEDGLKQLNALTLKSGNTSGNQKALAAAKEDLRVIEAESKPAPVQPPLTPEPEPIPAPPKPYLEITSQSQLTLQEKAKERITISTTVKVPETTHDTTLRVEVHQGDALSEWEVNEVSRAEAFIDPTVYPMSVPREQEVWYRGQLLIPATGFSLTAKEEFATLMQIKHADDSGAVDGLYLWSGAELHWGEILGQKAASIVPGTSIDWMIQAYWSEDPSKALQRHFIGGQPCGSDLHKTIKPVGLYMKFGAYQDYRRPTGTVFHGGIVIGPTRASVGA